MKFDCFVLALQSVKSVLAPRKVGIDLSSIVNLGIITPSMREQPQSAPSTLLRRENVSKNWDVVQ